MFDTVNARSSTVSYGKPWVRPSVWASGAVTSEESQTALHGYAGFIIAPPVIPPLPLYAASLNDRIGYLATVAA